MSMLVECDGCGKTSPFTTEDYRGGQYVYLLPARWTRSEEGHWCPQCAKERVEEEQA